jgi:hypothetical protein
MRNLIIKRLSSLIFSHSNLFEQCWFAGQPVPITDLSYDLNSLSADSLLDLYEHVLTTVDQHEISNS